MFEVAFKAQLPIICVTTDDLANFEVSLQLLTGLKPQQLPPTKLSQANLPVAIFWTLSTDDVTVELYKTLINAEKQLVVINPDAPNSLMFDAGLLPTPESMITDYLSSVTEDPYIQPLSKALKGLSLKTASEVVQLTMARTSSLELSEIRRTRAMVGASIPGLQPVDSELDFYLCPPQITEWLDTNTKYFLNPTTHHKLVPRGLMLAGAPGVGKSMAAKAIANHYKVQLFRLDISASLDRYVGESEGRVARSLSMLERESPCVLLLDEVEKIFSDQDDNGVTTRILSQLLWWLAEHRSKVLTVMTTNNLETIPPELYRAGRVDKVVDIPELPNLAACDFARSVFVSVIGASPTLKQNQTIREAILAYTTTTKAHVLVAEIVYDLIKKHSW